MTLQIWFSRCCLVIVWKKYKNSKFPSHWHTTVLQNVGRNLDGLGFRKMEDFLNILWPSRNVWNLHLIRFCGFFNQNQFIYIDISFAFRSGIITTGRQLSKIVRPNSVIHKIYALLEWLFKNSLKGRLALEKYVNGYKVWWGAKWAQEHKVHFMNI